MLDLVAAETDSDARLGSGQTADLRRSALGDAGEILDARAKDAYRRRLAEIDDDIEQARAIGDAGLAAQAEVERDFLIRELAHALAWLVVVDEPPPRPSARPSRCDSRRPPGDGAYR